MQSQDELSTFRPLNGIMSTPTQRSKLVRVLLQALHTMGFHDTARHLEKQSDVGMMHESVRKVHGSLEREEYRAARVELEAVVMSPQLKTELAQKIRQMQLLSLIHRGEHDSAIEQLTMSQIPEEDKVNYYEMIALSSSPSVLQLREKHQYIMDRLTNQSQQSNCLEKVINSFLDQPQIQQEKEEYPPTRVVAESEAFGPQRLKVSFVKFDPSGNRIVVVGESRSEVELSMFRLDGNRLEQLFHRKRESFGSINAVKWIGSEIEPWLALCCFERVIIVTAKDSFEKVCCIRRNQYQVNGRFLCTAWNPRSQLLFVGGLFSQLLAFNTNGRFLSYINRHLYAISATTGLLVRYSLEQEHQDCHFKQDKPFMDLRYDPVSHSLLTTTQTHIYVLNPTTLTQTHTLVSQTNPKLYKIQAMLCRGWVMVFNQQLVGHHPVRNSTLNSAWANCDAVDASSSGLLATFRGRLRLMGPAEGPSPQQIKQDESLSDESREDSESRIVSEQEEQHSAQQSQFQQDSYMQVEDDDQS